MRLLSSLDLKAVSIIRGNEPHPDTGESIDYITQYIEKLVGGTSGLSERIIQERHFQMFKICGTEAYREINAGSGRTDLLVPLKNGNVKVMEHKKGKSKREDVCQLLTYLLGNDKYQIGELIALEHPDAVRKTIHEINSLFKAAGKDKEIKASNIPKGLLNPNITVEEKEFLRNKKGRKK